LIFYLGLTATQQQPECMAVFNAPAAGGSQSRGAGRAQQHQTLPDPGCIRRLLSDPPGDAWQTCIGMGAIARRRVRWRAATECSVFDHSIAALVGKNAAIALDQRRKGNPSSDLSLGVTGKASS
jgi:hypothetical protein